MKLTLLLLLAYFVQIYAAPSPAANLSTLQRVRRQFDLTVSAEHDDKDDETDIALEAIANLWRSSDGNTQVEGSAKVVHHANSLQSGNTRYSAHLHVHHDYKRQII